MRRSRAVLSWLVPVVLVACALVAAAFVTRNGETSIVASTEQQVFPADGFSTVVITARSRRGESLRNVNARVVDGLHRATVQEMRQYGAETQIAVRAGVSPGPVTIEISAQDTSPQLLRLNTVLDPRDTTGDGTPDFMRLDSPADRRAFRDWFTFLAEYEAFRGNEDLSPEINDCAALIRYAYRESLREHDGQWADELRLQEVPGTSSVLKYRYPHTALGATLFRVKPGPFAPSEIESGAFAQFADAKVLKTLNSYFVSRDLARARAGDLLFFHQPGQRMPFHVMIFLGRSHFEKRTPTPLQLAETEVGANWIVYHTGPTGNWKGEIRRMQISELMRHPDPRWRPWSNNSSFLGIYRWNILREAND